MAEAFARAFFDPAIKIASAGTHPAAKINPIVFESMQEVGINMEGQHPKLLTPAMWKNDTRVIGMGWNVQLPSEVQAENWHIEDPHGQTLETIRKIRDSIKERVQQLLLEYR